jgi:hypothetical protein
VPKNERLTDKMLGDGIVGQKVFSKQEIFWGRPPPSKQTFLIPGKAQVLNIYEGIELGFAEARRFVLTWARAFCEKNKFWQGEGWIGEVKHEGTLLRRLMSFEEHK